MNFDPGLLLVFLFGGIIRVGTPYLYVSLGECVTERAGRVNLGLEGTLFMGAMAGYGVSYLSADYGLAPSLAPWLGVLAAGAVGVLLGALHGLEPGHSKTMMAAFIIAVRGTLMQAVLLGLAATVSHTAIVWLIALGGMYFGQQWSAEASEPWMQVISAVLIIGVAAWMLWRTSQDKAACFHDHAGEGGQGGESRNGGRRAGRDGSERGRLHSG